MRIERGPNGNRIIYVDETSTLTSEELEEYKQHLQSSIPKDANALAQKIMEHRMNTKKLITVTFKESGVSATSYNITEDQYLKVMDIITPGYRRVDPASSLKAIIQAGIRRDGPFTEENLKPEIQRHVLDALKTYTGSNPLLIAFEQRLRDDQRGGLTLPQLRSAANILYQEYKSSEAGSSDVQS